MILSFLSADGRARRLQHRTAGRARAITIETQDRPARHIGQTPWFHIRLAGALTGAQFDGGKTMDPMAKTIAEALRVLNPARVDLGASQTPGRALRAEVPAGDNCDNPGDDHETIPLETT